MIPAEQKKLWFLIGIIAVIAAGAFAGYPLLYSSTPVRIGVLLPLTGSVELREPLEWARDNINRHGGIGGRPIELVYKDTGSGDINQLAQELLADNSIRIVIGPPTSDDVYTFAPEFIRKKKLLISPLATSGDISRAFGNQGYFWRTTQGDTAQVKVMMNLLKEKEVNRVALLAENTTYGKTFYDWCGFFAMEYGLDLVSIQQFEPGSSTIDNDVAAALRSNPEYIIVACNPSDASTIKRAIDRSGKPVKLFFADAAVSPALISSLGSAAEGLEGTSPTADPSTGFPVAYSEKFGHPPTDYAAPVYDAVILAAYTSARQDAVAAESPADSMRAIVYGNGTSSGWDAQEVHDALLLIRSGKTPSVSGASGPLDYDTVSGVDPLVTYYSHWVIEGGEFRTIDIFGSGKSGVNGESVTHSRPSASLPLKIPSVPSTVSLMAKKDFKAVIVGPSGGWMNYRHEADALALYVMLRANGVPDDHIILMLYDDIPPDPANPFQGDVHNIPSGLNIRNGAHLDYTGSQVTAATLKNILTGRKTDSTPVVLETDASTDVFLYIVGHGTPGKIDFRWNDTFTTDDFTYVTDTMSKEKKYRQFVIIDDTCFGESIAINATAPGILYLTGASRSEPSFAAVYDITIRQWISDEFTSVVMGLIQENPAITFRELYNGAYQGVTGSHVQIIMTGNVSTLDEPVKKFLET